MCNRLLYALAVGSAATAYVRQYTCNAHSQHTAPFQLRRLIFTSRISNVINHMWILRSHNCDTEKCVRARSHNANPHCRRVSHRRNCVYCVLSIRASAALRFMRRKIDTVGSGAESLRVSFYIRGETTSARFLQQIAHMHMHTRARIRAKWQVLSSQ